MLLDFLICESRLFEGKKEFFKKSCFARSWGKLLLESLVQNIWYLVRELIERDNSVTGCSLF